MQDDFVAMGLVVTLVLGLIWGIVGTFEVQKTNRKFIEKGYIQVQMVGSTDYLWQLK